MTGGVIVRQVASGDRRGLCRCTQTSAMQPSGALARRLRARFCSRRARIAVAQGAQRRNHCRKTAGIRRMSVNESVPQQRWAAQRQAGSDGDTRLARGYIIYDGWCNRARGGADSTVVVAPTGATSPRQDAAGTLLLSVHDRSWLSSCRAKSAGSVSRSESRTTEQLNFKNLASAGCVWTAPLVQGVSEKNPDAVRFAVVCPACVLRPAAAGSDGFRDPLPNGKVTLVAATLRGFCGSSDRPISICSLEPCTRGPAARPRRQTCGQAAGCGR